MTRSGPALVIASVPWVILLTGCADGKRNPNEEPVWYHKNDPQARPYGRDIRESDLKPKEAPLFDLSGFNGIHGQFGL